MRLGPFAYKSTHTLVCPYPLHIRRFAIVKMSNKFTTDMCSPKMSVEELDRLSEKKLVFYLALCLQALDWGYRKDTMFSKLICRGMATHLQMTLAIHNQRLGDRSAA